MTMMLIFALLMAALIYCRLVLELKLRTGWKMLLALPVLAACCKNQITRLLGGPMFFAPDLPGWFLLFSAWLYAGAFLLFFALLFMEIVRLTVKAVFYCRKRKMEPEKYRKIYLRIDLILLVLALVLSGYGIWRGTAEPAIREITLTFADLPPEADGFRIALLADLHADRQTRAPRIRRFVELANALKPDLIAVVGDFVDGKVPERGQELLPLRELKAPLGVYAVPGNHEYYSGYRPWMDFLSGLGLKMLENLGLELPNRIYLAGVTDPAAYRVGGTVPDLKKALRGAAAGSFILLLAHQPALAHEAAGAGVSLQLSGHTHGGMIYGLDRIVGQFNGGFVSGRYKVGGMELYVSNGTGIWNGFPVRLGREAEITLITLKSH